jgi:hypothetical protein
MKKLNSKEAASDLVCASGASKRPIRDVLRASRLLPTTAGGEIDFDGTSAQTLAALAANADSSMRAIHLGLGSLGHLLARSSVEIADGTFSAECMANLGFLMAELGDVAAECLWIAGQCHCAAVTRRTEAAHADGQ